ncbi:MAG: class I SAM-dependent methyltransferase [Elusimicrobiota bacterium]
MSRLWKKASYAEKYSKNYFFSNKDIKFFIKKLKISKKDYVGDFGCGDGSFLAAAAKKASFVFGVDMSSAQLRAARKKMKSKNFKFFKRNFSDVANLPFFNKGFARKSLHHLKLSEKKRFFKEISKKMPKGSLFVIEDGIFFRFSRKELKKNWENLMKDCRKYYGKEWEKKKKDVVYCFKKEYPCGLSEWKKALSTGGFVIKEAKKYSSFYGYIAAIKEK